MQDITLGSAQYLTLADPAPMEEDVPDVDWRKTPGNKEIAVLLGPIVRKRGYRIYLPVAEQSAFASFISGLASYSETFTLVDHNGVSITARFLVPPKRTVLANGAHFVDLEMIEVL